MSRPWSRMPAAGGTDKASQARTRAPSTPIGPGLEHLMVARLAGLPVDARARVHDFVRRRVGGLPPEKVNARLVAQLIDAALGS